MKTLPLITSVALATGLLVSVAAAQTSTELATPSSAPAYATPSTPAPEVAGAARPAPDRIIYVPRLPSAAELSNLAKAQGLTIEQIDQTAADVTITYRFPDGRTNAVAYQLLPEGGAAQAPAAVVGKTAPTVVYYTPESRVVYYTPAPRVSYYSSAAYYDPFYYPWYGPVALSFGFGYGFHGHGHFGGGNHHGRW